MIIKYIEFLDDLWIWYYGEDDRLRCLMCNGGTDNPSVMMSLTEVRNYPTKNPIIHDDREL